MDTNTIIDLGKKYLKGKVVLKAGKALLTKRAGFIGLGIGAAAGAGYLAYTLISKNKDKINEKIQPVKDKFNDKIKSTKKYDQDLTRIDDIENNNHDAEGKKIVI